jgi:hypothetical protein
MFDTSAWRRLLGEFEDLLSEVPEELTAVKLSEDRWSLREIVGHLVDSAANNHQRFVRLQLIERLQFPAYAGETWVQLQGYNELDWGTLKALWSSYNRLLLHLIGRIEPAALGHSWEVEERSLTLEQLVADYYRHMAEHLAHFRTRLEEVKRAG